MNRRRLVSALGISGLLIMLLNFPLLGMVSGAPPWQAALYIFSVLIVFTLALWKHSRRGRRGRKPLGRDESNSPWP